MMSPRMMIMARSGDIRCPATVCTAAPGLSDRDREGRPPHCRRSDPGAATRPPAPGAAMRHSQIRQRTGRLPRRCSPGPGEHHRVPVRSGCVVPVFLLSRVVRAGARVRVVRGGRPVRGSGGGGPVAGRGHAPGVSAAGRAPARRPGTVVVAAGPGAGRREGGHGLPGRGGTRGGAGGGGAGGSPKEAAISASNSASQPLRVGADQVRERRVRLTGGQGHADHPPGNLR